MKYYIDGFTKLKNPSPIGGGYSIFDENNTLIKVENIDKVGMTNNEAELLGLLNCLKEVKMNDTISTDSMNTIAWIRSKKDKKIARQDLLSLILQCRQIINSCNINLMWEGRDHNLAGIYNEKTGIDTGMFKDIVKEIKIEVEKSLLKEMQDYILKNEEFLNELYEPAEKMPDLFIKIENLLK